VEEEQKSRAERQIIELNRRLNDETSKRMQVENKARDALTELDKWNQSEELREFMEWKQR
jgi:hypothetical protein